jgi:hypothetical protein
MPISGIFLAPADELVLTALLSQLPLHTLNHGSVVSSLTDPALFQALRADPNCDFPFAADQHARFFQLLQGLTLLTGPTLTAAGLQVVAATTADGRTIMAIACSDAAILAAAGAGKCYFGSGQMPFGGPAGTTAASRLQTALAELSTFIVNLGSPSGGLVLTGWGLGGTLALALRTQHLTSVQRVYSFEAIDGGLHAALLAAQPSLDDPLTGPSLDSAVLDVRLATADRVQWLTESTGLILLVDPAGFGVDRPGPLANTALQGSRIDRAMGRLLDRSLPVPLLAALLQLGDDLGTRLPTTHYRRRLTGLLGGHLQQIGDTVRLVLLTRDYDGTARLDLAVVGSEPAAVPLSRSLSLPLSGDPVVRLTPGRIAVLSRDGQSLRGRPTLRLQSVALFDDPGSPALSLDPLSGELQPPLAQTDAAGLMVVLLQGNASGIPTPLPTEPAAEMAAALQLYGAWQGDGADGPLAVLNDPAVGLYGISDPGHTLFGLPAVAEPDDAGSGLNQIIEELTAAFAGTLADRFGLNALAPEMTARLRTSPAGMLLAAEFALVCGRVLDSPAAWQWPAVTLQSLVSGTVQRTVSGLTGLSNPVSIGTAFAQTLAAVELPLSPSLSVPMSAIWAVGDPFAPRFQASAVLFAGLPLNPAAVLVNLVTVGCAADLPELASGSPATITVTVSDPSPTRRDSVDVTSPAGWCAPDEILSLPAQVLMATAMLVIREVLRQAPSLSASLPLPVRLHHNRPADSFQLSSAAGVQEFAGSARIGLFQAIIAGLAAAVVFPDTDTQGRLTADWFRRGWFDWVIRAQFSAERGRLPSTPGIYALFDGFNSGLKQLLEPETARPQTGTTAEILTGLLTQARTVALAVRSRLTAMAGTAGSPPPLTGSPAESVFLSLYPLLFQLSSLAARSGTTVSTLAGLDAVDPSVPPHVYDPHFAALNRWLSETQTTEVDLSAVVIDQPDDVRTTVLLSPSGSGILNPVIRVTWAPLPADASLWLEWRINGGNGFWNPVETAANASFHDLQPVQIGKTYQIRLAVRAAADANHVRRQSAWTHPVEILVQAELTRGRVARLELAGQSTGTVFGGRNVRLRWDGVFPDNNAVLGSEPGGVGTGQANPLLEGYIVRVYDPETGALLRQNQPQTATEYVYQYEDNVFDSGPVGPRRRLRFAVSIVQKFAPEIGKAVLEVENPAPLPVTPSVRAGIGALYVTVPPSTDIDIGGYRVWLSSDADFDPLTTPPAYDGPQNAVAFERLQVGTWHVRAAAIDAFGDAGLQVGPVVSVALVDRFIDTEPPAVPTGLSLSSRVSFAPSGEQIVTLSASWNAATEEDFSHYELTVSEGGGAPIPFMVHANRWEQAVRPNVACTVQVRAVDRSSNDSAYCQPVSLTTARDQTPPGAPTGLTTLSGLRSIWLQWTNPTDADLDVVEVWSATGNDRANASRVAAIRSTAFAHNGLNPGEQRYYWLRAVDTSGNVGPWHPEGATTGVAGTTPRALADDIADAQIETAKFAQGIEPVAVVSALPAPAGYTGPKTVFLTTDGKIYRYVNNAWTAAVPTADLSGVVTSGQIADSAINTAKFAQGIEPIAVVSSLPNPAGYTGPKTVFLSSDGKIYRYSNGTWTSAIPAIDVTGKLTNEQIDSISAAKLTGAITSSQITAGAIIADKIAANAITAEKIEANAVTAGKINANAVTADKIDANAVTAGKIIAGAVGADQIAANAISAIKIAADAITSDKIATNAITADKIEANAVTAGKINANAVTADKIDANAITAGKIIAGAVGADQIAANAISANKIATNAIYARHIVGGEITAEKIAAGTITADKLFGDLTGNLFSPSTSLPAAITVGSTGVNIGTIESRAANPAARINANSTLIEPGKIQISGSTTLSNWRAGGDNTQINGGAIAANTITANKITIGNRGIHLAGCDFSVNGNTLTWSAGFIHYLNDLGNPAIAAVPQSFVNWSSGTVYIYWINGEATLRTTTVYTSATGDDRVLIGSYNGGNDFSMTMGRTIIEGDRIRTNTISANKLNVGELSAITANLGTITAGTLNVGVIYAGSIVASQITSGSIATAELTLVGGGGYVALSGPLGRFQVTDANGVGRVAIGHLHTGDYGIFITDAQSNVLFDAQGANGVRADRISAGQLAAGVVYAGTINAEQIRAGKLGVSGDLTIGDAGGITLRGATRQLFIGPENGRRVILGEHGGQTGIWVYDASGNTVLNASGLGTNVVGTDQVSSRAITDFAFTTGPQLYIPYQQEMQILFVRINKPAGSNVLLMGSCTYVNTIASWAGVEIYLDVHFHSNNNRVRIGRGDSSIQGGAACMTAFAVDVYDTYGTVDCFLMAKFAAVSPGGITSTPQLIHSQHLSATVFKR